MTGALLVLKVGQAFGEATINLMSSSIRTWLTLAILGMILAGTACAQNGSQPVVTPPTGAAPAAGTPAPSEPAAGAAKDPGPAVGAPKEPEPAASAPGGPDPILSRLVDQGLENVSVQRDGRQIRIAYENRRYRWDVTGLGVVMAVAAKEAPADAELVVTPKIWGVPELQVRVPAGDYQRFLDGTLSEAELRHHFSMSYQHGGPPAGGKNRSFGRTDLTGGLGFRASFTSEDPNEGFHPRFLTGLEGAALPGLGYTAQETFPLENLPPKLTQARIGGVLHPVGPFFVALSGGRLTEDLDAVGGEAAWMAPSGNTSARLTFAAGQDRFFAQSAHSALFTLTQWIGHRDIAVSLVGGRFWEGDQGAEFLIQSGFRERRFIIGVGHSDGVTRTDVQVVLPLGPRVRPEPKTLRFTIRDTFNARYGAPTQGRLTEIRVGGVVPPSLLQERTMLFSSPIVRAYLKELRRSADLLQ